MSQPSAYYSAFAYVAPMDSPEYPVGYLDEEDANDIATFFCAGMANRVAIEKLNEERAAFFEKLDRTNRVAGLVLDFMAVR